MNKYKIFGVVFMLIIVLLSGCSNELIDQTPIDAATSAKIFVDRDTFGQFQDLFDENAVVHATEELYLALKESSTAGSGHNTYHFSTMENGDIWMILFMPKPINGKWKIQSIKLLENEQSALLKEILEL